MNFQYKSTPFYLALCYFDISDAGPRDIPTNKEVLDPVLGKIVKFLTQVE